MLTGAITINILDEEKERESQRENFYATDIFIQLTIKNFVLHLSESW